MRSKVLAFLKHNTVFAAAFVLCILSMIAVPVDSKYLSYPDYKTLACLFCMSAVVSALWNINFFYVIAQHLIRLCKNLRRCVLALSFITFIGSLFIANDMALITFLPLSYYVLITVHKEKYMAFVFVLQNIAANLGGMLTPFGNPQNLYLYSYYSIPNAEFLSIMFPPFIVSVAMITLSCLFIPRESLSLEGILPSSLNRRRVSILLILFALSVIIVFRIVPYGLGLAVIPLALMIVDRKALKTVDYYLLGTFLCFFILSGNLSRIEAVQSFISGLLSRSVLLTGIFSCQFISNVPSAILLSQFTQQYRPLLLSVNIGGTGTLIASLASLITFREYMKHNPGGAWRYLKTFAVMNILFLSVLTLLCLRLTAG